MKILNRNARLLAFCLLLAPFSARSEGGVPPTGIPAPQKEEMEVRQKVMEASKEINGSPELKKLKADLDNAQNAYTEAFEAALVKKDPELAAKYKQLREATMERFRAPRPEAAAKLPSGYDTLSEEEKKKLFEARKQAMESPALKDARQKRNAAKTEEERKTAEQEYKTALRSAMMEVDAKLEGLLDKLEGKSGAKTAPSPAQSPVGKK
jgi:DNA repair exonuclease SbcCD ATPase subunit